VSELVLSRDQYLEFEKLAFGAFAPLTGFMDEAQFRGVVSDMRLPSGAVFSLPVVLAVSAEDARRLRGLPRVTLLHQGETVGELTPESIYTCDKQPVAAAVFGTADPQHPGVRAFLNGGDWFIGGPVRLHRRVQLDISGDELTPQQTRAIFAERGWKTIVGFQTRNVPHRAHEYLQRVALEQVDGLFIQPLVGRKKAGDYTPQAIMTAYRHLVRDVLRSEGVVLGILSTAMRYAGPREAVFHAIIRRNYGCTHFIVGRDHAGVGNYYDKYAGHDLTRRFAGELGIEIMRLHGPYHCRRCGGIATEQTCGHYQTQPDAIREISGTMIRAVLSGGETPDPELIRPEIIAALKGVPLFIDEDEA
jgi:sulfate adenylyltransferase